MNYDELVRFIQQHFTDGLVLIVGSGLSCAEGMPGMAALTGHLIGCDSATLSAADATKWKQIETALASGEGLEAVLMRLAPSLTLEEWIVSNTCQLLLPVERKVISAVMSGGHSLRLTRFLNKILKPSNGLPILTTNYDRLIETACEMAGLHVDTTAIGLYGGRFDHLRSCMGSCRGIVTRARTTVLDHFPRAVVLKPHGSFDWYQAGSDPRRCSIDLDAERLIITPGINKYRAGYDSPFDKHRELANEFIKQSARLLIVGYGFNDDHLQTHLEKRILDGTPTLILCENASDYVLKLANESPQCICMSRPTSASGTTMVTRGSTFTRPGENLWDLGILTQEVLV